MTKLILSIMLFSCLATNAQQKNTNQTQQNRTMPMYPKIFFSYDSEGNQIERKFEWSNTAKSANPVPKEIVLLKEDDIQEIYANDLISYYPNPLKDELYLQWESNQDNAVVSINLFDLNGQLLQTYPNSTNSNSLNISFLNYPTGVYAVVLVYNKGNQKSIKIIKQ